MNEQNNNAKNNTLKLWFVLILIVFALWYFMPGGSTHEVPSSQVVIYGEAFVKIFYPELPLINEIRCYDQLDYKYSMVANYSFINLRDYNTVSILQGEIRYNIRFRNFEYFLDFNGFENSEAFKSLVNQTEEDEFFCRTELLTDNNIYAEVWDEGYKEVKQLNLFEPLNFFCFEETPSEWFCGIEEGMYTLDLLQDLQETLIKRAIK